MKDGVSLTHFKNGLEAEGEVAYEENAENYPLQESLVQDSILAESA
jgi:hypothetical protein